jgi:hypothetical protein
VTSTLFRCSHLAMILASLLSLPACAEQRDGRGITGEEVVAILQDLGYRAKLGKDSVGDPMVTTGMGGLTTMVYFYDCVEGRCGSLQLSVGLDLKDGTSADVVNAYNKGYRYGRVYLDEENDPYLAFDFEVLHTDHAAHVASQVSIFENVIGNFTRETGYSSGSVPQGGSTDAGKESVPDSKPEV